MAILKDKLLDELVASISNITEAESNIYDCCQKLEETQNKIGDIEHYLEDHEITRNGAINLISLLQKLRIERRQIKQMWEIWNVYGLNREKLNKKIIENFLSTILERKIKNYKLSIIIGSSMNNI